MTHSIILEPFTRCSQTNAPAQRYRVLYGGETLIENTHNPEYEACRALLAKGITGTLETYREGLPYPCMRLDIEKGAKLTILETPTTGPRRVVFKPWDGDSLVEGVGNFPREHAQGIADA